MKKYIYDENGNINGMMADGESMSRDIAGVSSSDETLQRRTDSYRDSEIWQSMSLYRRAGTCYRRDIIHEYYRTSLSLTDSTRCLLLSRPSMEDIDTALGLRKKGRSIRIVYDRTDFWSDRDADDYCVANADFVINSSRWLYEHCGAESKVYIPNRCVRYSCAEKERKKIAIYAGYNTQKVDAEWLGKWIEDHPDYEFECYTYEPVEGFEKYWKPFIKESELFEHMCGCEIGLLPFNGGRWARGMLPLKYFMYRNAGLKIERTDVAKYNTEEFDSLDAPFSWSDVIYDFNRYLSVTGKDLLDMPKAEITQIMKSDSSGVHRRSAVQERFKWTKNALRSETAFFSYPPELMVYSFDKCIYDRTDNWTAQGMDESAVLGLADLVICSSRWLFKDTLEKYPGKKTVYVPNGNAAPSGDVPEKHGRKTAIYAGWKLDKVAMDKLAGLAKANPEWTIEVFANECDWLTMLASNIEPHDFTSSAEILEETRRCHVGLCLLVENDWTRGMLPDKVLLYGNCGIPCVYSGIPEMNVSDFGWCVPYADSLSLDEVSAGQYKFFTRTWNDVCADIKKTMVENGFDVFKEE